MKIPPAYPVELVSELYGIAKMQVRTVPTCIHLVRTVPTCTLAKYANKNRPHLHPAKRICV